MKLSFASLIQFQFKESCELAEQAVIRRSY